VNLFVGSTARIPLGGNVVTIKQDTRYPWDGHVRMSVDPEKSARFAVNVRIPGWTGDEVTPGSLYRFVDPSTGGVTLTVNGPPVEVKPDRGFARIEGRWGKGDAIELTLPMPVRRVSADPRVKDDDGRVALERGPLVYCAEWVDNGGRALNLVVPDN